MHLSWNQLFYFLYACLEMHSALIFFVEKINKNNNNFYSWSVLISSLYEDKEIKITYTFHRLQFRMFSLFFKSYVTYCKMHWNKIIFDHIYIDSLINLYLFFISCVPYWLKLSFSMDVHKFSNNIVFPELERETIWSSTNAFAKSIISL